VTRQRRLDAFLDRVRRVVGGPGRRADLLTDEIRDHLTTAIEDLRRRGLDPDEAERVAIERFGPPEAILNGYELEANVMTLWLSRVLALLAAVTTVVAAIIVIHSIAFDDGSAAVEAVKIGQSALVIAAGLITLRYWSRGKIQSAAAMGGVGIWLAVSGAAGAAWTLRLAQTTGDLMVAAQGTLLAWMAIARSARA
jgi:hypothetical protein